MGDGDMAGEGDGDGDGDGDDPVSSYIYRLGDIVVHHTQPVLILPYPTLPYLTRPYLKVDKQPASLNPILTHPTSLNPP